jgi:hypothetical protein
MAFAWQFALNRKSNKFDAIPKLNWFAKMLETFVNKINSLA